MRHPTYAADPIELGLLSIDCLDQGLNHDIGARIRQFDQDDKARLSFNQSGNEGSA
jgi:hypothetical protein